MEQRAIFLEGEGNGWWRRNAQALTHSHANAIRDPATDPVLKSLIQFKPASVLEIGAANGWRLDVAHRLWGARGYGIEPSAEAVADGAERFADVTLQVGTADKLPDAQFDCVVYGFCLYLCDRSDLFRIAAEGDRVLKPGGYLVILDFFPPHSYQNPYTHRPGVFAHKMDHSRLWSWHPAYVLWRHEVTAHEGKNPDEPNERLGVTVLKKN